MFSQSNYRPLTGRRRPIKRYVSGILMSSLGYLLYIRVICQQGVGDFVGLTSGEFIKRYNFINISYIESSSLVASLMKYKSERSRMYLRYLT